MSDDLIVLKFGSSVLRTREDLPNAVHEIYRWYRDGHRVIAVVSAIGEATDHLLGEALQICEAPEGYATAELLATGERASAALVGIALDRSGIPARVLNPREIRLTVAGTPLDSEIFGVDVQRVRELLTEYPVLVVPGFFGTDVLGRTHVLGRGGSDLSAVYLAQALGARCRLLKDVDGVYESDPAATPGARPRRFRALSYTDAFRVAGALIQPKAVSFLRQHGMAAEVAAPGAGFESRVHEGPTELGDSPESEPTRVLLLGLGTVGLGVYQRLKANPQAFKVSGILVRDRGKYESLGVPAGLLRSRIDQVLKLKADVVIDALPGPEPSRRLAEHFIREGSHLISTGKALIADHGVALAELAMQGSTRLTYSAAVGGAAAMVEAIDRARSRGPIASLAGVLNGTCNYVLERCALGLPLEGAVAEARRAGFAEENAMEDLAGRDAIRKLRILVRHAFGAEARQIDAEQLDRRVAAHARDVAARGMRLRQVARAWRQEGTVHAAVRFEEVERGSSFGRLGAEWNALEVMGSRGRCVLAGRGTGRWPTTESVLADLFEVRRSGTAQSA